MTAPTTSADKWMEAGLDEYQSAKSNAHKAKVNALMAGYFFLRARKTIANGDWADYVECFKSKISYRTVRDYCSFTQEVIEQARRENPKITDPDKLIEIGKTMVIESPRSYVALLRDIGQFPLQGQYDADRYAINKHKGDDQQEFTFSYETVIEQLKVVEAAPNFYKLSVKALDDLAARCESTAKLCRKVRTDRETKQTKTLELIEA